MFLQGKNKNSGFWETWISDNFIILLNLPQDEDSHWFFSVYSWPWSQAVLGLDTVVQTGLDTVVQTGLETVVHTGLDTVEHTGLDTVVHTGLDTVVQTG